MEYSRGQKGLQMHSSHLAFRSGVKEVGGEATGHDSLKRVGWFLLFLLLFLSVIATAVGTSRSWVL